MPRIAQDHVELRLKESAKIRSEARLLSGALTLRRLMRGRERILHGPFTHAVATEIAVAFLEGMRAVAAPGN